MAIFFLIYILVCFKTGLGVHWYDWTIFAFLEIVAIIRLLYTEEVRKAYDKGVTEAYKDIPPIRNDLFKDV